MRSVYLDQNVFGHMLDEGDGKKRSIRRGPVPRQR
jgi:hypothetical protein